MPTGETEFLRLLLQASLPVQLVMLVLVLASLVSWAMIFHKRRVLKLAYSQADKFEETFWTATDLNPLYRRINASRYSASGMEHIFEAGYREYTRIREQGSADPNVIMEGAQRAMHVALGREAEYLQTQLPFLATVGGTSPYIGLLGTVWGIMETMRALGSVQYATIAMVGPGISEALIATAMGLFAAIPAGIAYNLYSHQADRLLSRYDSFTEEFSTFLHRHVHTSRQPPGPPPASPAPSTAPAPVLA